MSPDRAIRPPPPDNDTGLPQPTLNVPASATIEWHPTAGAADSADDHQADFAPAPVIPGYELLEEVGRGGMGVVFKARHLKLNRIVALKMILRAELASEQEAGRLRTEAETIAHIQHPNIIQIFEIGEHEGRLFLSLEYCGGGSLESLLRGKPLPATDAVRLLLTCAGAIEHAHLCGVIHRDLKPANILLQDQSPQSAKRQDLKGAPGEGTAESAPLSAGRSPGPRPDVVPKITDFGLAQTVTEAGQSSRSTVTGSPSYMSPEQAEGREVDARSDIYSLGATLYECLTGRPPFCAATVLETLSQVQRDEPVPSRHLQSTILRDVDTIPDVFAKGRFAPLRLGGGIA